MQVKIYSDKFGYSPFEEWFNNLGDKLIKARVLARIDRIYEGNLGDHKFLRDHIWELRFNFGSGFRVYFTKENNQIVLLLYGGNKATQGKDILKAIVLYQKFLEERDEA